jgi:O-antigen/teichoic acid export membrane protein
VTDSADGERPSLIARTARGAGWIIALRVAARSMGFLSTLVLARYLAPHDFGVVAVSLGFLQALDTLSFIGVEEALIRERAPTRGMYDTGFTLNLLRGLALGLLMALAAWPVAEFFDQPEIGPVLMVLAAAVAVESFTNIGLVEFWRNMDFAKEVRLTILPRVAGLGVAIVTAVLFETYWALVIGASVQRAARVAISYISHPYRPRLSLTAWRALLGYSAWTWAISAAVVVRDRANVFMIGRTMDPTGAGIFTIAWDIASTPTQELIAPLQRAAFSGFAAARHEGENIAETYLRLVGGAALITLPIGVGLSLTAAPLVRLGFGPQWAEAVPAVHVLSIACAASVFGLIAWTILFSHARLAACFRITLATAGVRVVLLALLLPHFGLLGAAFATAASILVDVGLQMYYVVRYFEVSLRKLARRTWRCVAASAVMGFVVWAIGLGWAPLPGSAMATGLQLLQAIAAGVSVYAATLLLLWLASGRPAGAEADMLAVLRRAAGRIGSDRA